MCAETNVQIANNDGVPIRSFSEWAQYALPPKRRDIHWAPGRSACELGRLWTVKGAPCAPDVLTDLLDSRRETRDAVIVSGTTECETRIPPGSHGPRCHDLRLVAKTNCSDLVICIEAKADEPFGGTV